MKQLLQEHRIVPFAIFLLIITANFPMDIHVPAMPLISEQLGISISSTQWTVGLFLGSSAIL